MPSGVGRRLRAYRAVDTLAEPPFTDMLKRKSEAVRPDELVDIEVAAACQRVFTGKLVFNDQHLCGTITFSGR